MSRSVFDLVVFDKDGTLIDLNETWGRPFANMLTALTDSAAVRNAIADHLGFDEASATSVNGRRRRRVPGRGAPSG